MSVSPQGWPGALDPASTPPPPPISLHFRLPCLHHLLQPHPGERKGMGPTRLPHTPTSENHVQPSTRL